MDRQLLNDTIKLSVKGDKNPVVGDFEQQGGLRTGRILNLLYLMYAGLLSQPMLYLSKYIIINKENYYYNLGIVTQRGSWKPWILYMLMLWKNTSHLTSQLINNIIAQMEVTLIHAKGKIKWYSKEANELIFSQPYVKPQLIGDRLGITSRTALTKYFGELVDAKILSPIKDGREMFYFNDDLVRILEN